ncbi:hypothetical protein [Oenococcus sicerae]|uniref:hypothetical protein n=1 Tax=Oenococcus sicerae TaxID=2203724 RepID=UPI00265AFC78|nr:hypothetical protein [Oenococcus sicerae]
MGNGDIDPRNKKQVQDYLTQHPVKLLYYQNSRSFSSWDSSDSRRLKEPIIEVMTSGSLDDLNAMNLLVTGIDNPLKLDKKVVDSRRFQQAIQANNLSDNQLSFGSIKDSLSADRSLFYKNLAAWSSFLVVLLVAIVQTIISLNMIWQAAHQKQLFVKRLIGYSALRKYAGMYGLITIVDSRAALFGLLLKSHFVVIGCMVLYLSELLTVYLSTNKIESQKNQ